MNEQGETATCLSALAQWRADKFPARLFYPRAFAAETNEKSAVYISNKIHGVASQKTQTIFLNTE